LRRLLELLLLVAFMIVILEGIKEALEKRIFAPCGQEAQALEPLLQFSL
jgi:hypothetical protein